MTPRPDWPWPPDVVFLDGAWPPEIVLAMPHAFDVRPMTPAETQAYADEYQRDAIAAAESDAAMAANTKEYAK